MEVIESLDPLLKAFWIIAIPASLVFIIQTIMTFMGEDTTDGIEADFDGDLSDTEAPFQLFTLRNLLNFLLGFSWTGISFYTTIVNKSFLLALSILVGALFVYMFFLVIKQIQKLAEDNTFRLTDTLNKTADVYLTIPEYKKGKGKIMISIKGSFHELEAMTEKQKIESGSVVKVVRIESNNILIVEPV